MVWDSAFKVGVLGSGVWAFKAYGLGFGALALGFGTLG